MLRLKLTLSLGPRLSVDSGIKGITGSCTLFPNFLIPFFCFLSRHRILVGTMWS
jgi:hypothetical protein